MNWNNFLKSLGTDREIADYLGLKSNGQVSIWRVGRIQHNKFVHRPPSFKHWRKLIALAKTKGINIDIEYLEGLKNGN